MILVLTMTKGCAATRKDRKWLVARRTVSDRIFENWWQHCWSLEGYMLPRDETVRVCVAKEWLAVMRSTTTGW